MLRNQTEKPNNMLKFKLKTHVSAANYTESHFFILNKGLNSGKPLLQPCPNCFVCICETEESKTDLYWLLFVIWQSKTVHNHLIGSVIPFIRINELSNIIDAAIQKFSQNPEKVKKNIATVVQIEEKRKSLLAQFNLMQELKQALIMEALR